MRKKGQMRTRDYSFVFLLDFQNLYIYIYIYIYICWGGFDLEEKICCFGKEIIINIHFILCSYNLSKIKCSLSNYSCLLFNSDCSSWMGERVRYLQRYSDAQVRWGQFRWSSSKFKIILPFTMRVPSYLYCSSGPYPIRMIKKSPMSV